MSSVYRELSDFATVLETTTKHPTMRIPAVRIRRLLDHYNARKPLRKYVPFLDITDPEELRRRMDQQADAELRRVAACAMDEEINLAKGKTRRTLLAQQRQLTKPFMSTWQQLRLMNPIGQAQRLHRFLVANDIIEYTKNPKQKLIDGAKKELLAKKKEYIRHFHRHPENLRPGDAYLECVDQLVEAEAILDISGTLPQSVKELEVRDKALDKSLPAILKNFNTADEQLQLKQYQRIRATFSYYLDHPHKANFRGWLQSYYLPEKKLDPETYQLIVILNYLGHMDLVREYYNEFFSEEDPRFPKHANKPSDIHSLLNKFVYSLHKNHQLVAEKNLKPYGLSDGRKQQVLRQWKIQSNRFATKYNVDLALADTLETQQLRDQIVAMLAEHRKLLLEDEAIGEKANKRLAKYKGLVNAQNGTDSQKEALKKYKLSLLDRGLTDPELRKYENLINAEAMNNPTLLAYEQSLCAKLQLTEDENYISLEARLDGIHNPPSKKRYQQPLLQLKQDSIAALTNARLAKRISTLKRTLQASLTEANCNENNELCDSQGRTNPKAYQKKLQKAHAFLLKAAAINSPLGSVSKLRDQYKNTKTEKLLVTKKLFTKEEEKHWFAEPNATDPVTGLNYAYSTVVNEPETKSYQRERRKKRLLLIAAMALAVSIALGQGFLGFYALITYTSLGPLLALIPAVSCAICNTRLFLPGLYDTLRRLLALNLTNGVKNPLGKIALSSLWGASFAMSIVMGALTFIAVMGISAIPLMIAWPLGIGIAATTFSGFFGLMYMCLVGITMRFYNGLIAPIASRFASEFKHSLKARSTVATLLKTPGLFSRIAFNYLIKESLEKFVEKWRNPLGFIRILSHKEYKKLLAKNLNASQGQLDALKQARNMQAYKAEEAKIIEATRVQAFKELQVLAEKIQACDLKDKNTLTAVEERELELEKEQYQRHLAQFAHEEKMKSAELIVKTVFAPLIYGAGAIILAIGTVATLAGWHVEFTNFLQEWLSFSHGVAASLSAFLVLGVTGVVDSLFNGLNIQILSGMASDATATALTRSTSALHRGLALLGSTVGLCLRAPFSQYSRDELKNRWKNFWKSGQHAYTAVAENPAQNIGPAATRAAQILGYGFAINANATGFAALAIASASWLKKLLGIPTPVGKILAFTCADALSVACNTKAIVEQIRSENLPIAIHGCYETEADKTKLNVEQETIDYINDPRLEVLYAAQEKQRSGFWTKIASTIPSTRAGKTLPSYPYSGPFKQQLYPGSINYANAYKQLVGDDSVQIPEVFLPSAATAA